ncbi:MAG TPA: hypothetical protein VF458_10420, partial [Ktedonobacteraceae bacterium]
MKTFADDTDRSDEYSRQLQDDLLDAAQSGFRSAQADKVSRDGGKGANDGKYTRFFPYVPLFVMVCAILLLDAILPLRDLWFHEAQLTQLGTWPVLPSQILFPGWTVIPPIPQVHVGGVPDIPPSWGTLGLLFGAFAAVFLTYIFALRRLPSRVTKRFVVYSTLVLGLLFMLIPVVTSPDLYSYIAYARIGVVYHMNPLTTIPHAIHKDVIYNYVLWVDQPSAYGPSWTLLTCLFQWILSLCQVGNYVLAMVLTLRAWGLSMHLASVALIWSISGSLQSLHGIVSQEKRLRATLAFAWNPLLLLEAATNAHNDTTLLFIILLIVWLLVRAQLAPEKPTAARWIAWLNPTLRARAVYLLPAVLLALGTCLKINLVLLAPGLFFYQWLQEAQQPANQRLKRVGTSIAVYAGLILGLYAPFWQGGAILDVFQVNPSTYRTINTLSDTLSHLYNGVVAAFGFPVGAQIGSPAEHFLRTLTIGIFVLLYAGICWQTLRTPGTLRSIHGLVRWLTVTWLLYCAIGSPWFWPWYMITFFGLYALFEASKPAQLVLEEEYTRPASRQASISRLFKQFQNLLLQPTVVRGLTFSMLTIYCFTTWGPQHSFIPGLPGLQWSYLAGVWAWLLPLACLKLANRGTASLLQKKSA